MKYQDYLQTRYWWTISEFTKTINNYRCEKCGKKKNLNVHHLNYKCIGYEHLDTHNKLKCLCEKCHNEIHKKYKI